MNSRNSQAKPGPSAAVISAVLTDRQNELLLLSMTTAQDTSPIRDCWWADLAGPRLRGQLLHQDVPDQPQDVPLVAACCAAGG